MNAACTKNSLHAEDLLTMRLETVMRRKCVQDGEERLHAFSAADLRAVHAASAESPERAAAHRSRWMLNRGTLPPLDAMSEVGAGALTDKSGCMTVFKPLKGLISTRQSHSKQAMSVAIQILHNTGLVWDL